MRLLETIGETEYPETDGRLIGQSDLHRKGVVRIFDLLSYRYRRQRVYVGCQRMVFPTENLPHEFVVPDVFVVLDCDRIDRHTFQTWNEARIPNAVFDVTSHCTKQLDQVFNPQAYAEMGVKEVFLYDPTGDYLKPILQGYRLEGGQSTPIERDPAGALECRELGLLLKLEKRKLVMLDRESGLPLLTEAEAGWAAQEAAEARAEAAEAELRRLREQIARQQSPS